MTDHRAEITWWEERERLLVETAAEIEEAAMRAVRAEHVAIVRAHVADLRRGRPTEAQD